MRHFRQVVLLFLCFVFAPVLASAADDLLLKARQALENGQVQETYDLLVPLQSDRAGDPEFDFLLGSAALALGKNTEAVFALERVLAMQPNNAPARAQIARAYFNLKETETARREFENVKKQEVPPEVSATIERFLEAIARVEESSRTVIRGFVEFSLGYDSNVNSATADNQVAIPAFGGLVFTLAPTATELEDEFIGFGGGLNFQHPFSRRLALFGGLAYQNRSNIDEGEFSTSSYDANLGLSYRRERDSFRLATQFNSFWVDDSQAYPDAYRNALGFTGQWQHDFDARNQFSAFVQYTNLAYPSQSIRDAKRSVGGVGYAHAFGRGTVVAYLGLYGGQEKPEADTVPQLEHDLYGARLGTQWNLSGKYALFFNASGEQREYAGNDAFFLVKRKDTQANASGGLIIFPKKNLRITPQVSWTSNSSNIQVNEFDRIVYQVMWRQDI